MKKYFIYSLVLFMASICSNAYAYETMREFTFGGSYGAPGNYLGGHLEWTNIQPSGFGFRHGPTFLRSGKDEIEVQGVQVELDAWRIDYFLGSVFRFGQAPRKGFFPKLLPTAVLGIPITYMSVNDEGFWSMSARLGGEVYVPIGLKSNGYSNVRYKLFGLAAYADYPLYVSAIDGSGPIIDDIEEGLKRLNLVLQLKFNFGRRK